MPAARGRNFSGSVAPAPSAGNIYIGFCAAVQVDVSKFCLSSALVQSSNNKCCHGNHIFTAIRLVSKLITFTFMKNKVHNTAGAVIRDCRLNNLSCVLLM